MGGLKLGKTGLRIYLAFVLLPLCICGLVVYLRGLGLLVVMQLCIAWHGWAVEARASMAGKG
jgi:hypothetical protein